MHRVNIKSNARITFKLRVLQRQHPFHAQLVAEAEFHPLCNFLRIVPLEAELGADEARLMVVPRF